MLLSVDERRTEAQLSAEVQYSRPTLRSGIEAKNAKLRGVRDWYSSIHRECSVIERKDCLVLVLVQYYGAILRSRIEMR